ncbi:tRNA lysidine(34) synthetase TilS [Streptococcus loxodontisalivarius]|uniref:tRNA(Ile)-lysidine synthase n=1 Tax=Streptococcus loxodontisalivarius TaxID=1349415 RepID=A0ABS2PPA6_9STRE|nr:tRNA lysidine(34) synthetase TilS [Streptococcus loxodontisalivarius]MBM7641867.1 tRNA(Ile)-lysidine synthase [Streptococcus loxodontisalivarius]
MTYSSIYQKLKSKQFFVNHQKVLVAVSTGVDSMNLLTFLEHYQAEFAIELGIAHINHHQRPQSDEEEAFIRRWGKEHEIPVYVGHFHDDFSENAARAFRYDFFAQLMSEHAYTALVTAHHKDDQAETVFMRLVRGSHLRHLSAIKEVQDFASGQLIRPFLSLAKTDLPDIFHFEDSSNSSEAYFRNRVRQLYLPQLEEENPQLSNQLVSLANQVSTWQEALLDLTKELEKENLPVFRSHTRPVQTVLLEQYLADFPDLHLTKAQFDQVLHLLLHKSHYQAHLKSGYYLLISDESYSISKISPETDSQERSVMLDYGGSQHFAGYHFSFEDNETEPIVISNQNHIKLRHRQPGDKISLGEGHKKLRRLFIDEKIPLSERSKAVVAEQDGEIIFVLANGRTYLRKGAKNDIMRAKLYIQKEEW